MKKFLLGTLVLVLALIGGGVYYVLSHLDTLVEEAIETAGTRAVGSPVTVDSVSIDLTGGSATVRGFAVANPQGYSEATMLGFQELAVVLDLNNISAQSIGIRSITARNPRVLYESRNRTSNLDTVASRFAATGQPAPAPADNPAAQVRLNVGNVLIEDIVASLNAEVLPRPMQVSLGDIRLENLDGTPSELATQILRPVVNQLARTAANALLAATSAQLRDSAEAVGQQVLDQAADRAEQAGEEIREGLGNLLNRD